VPAVCSLRGEFSSIARQVPSSASVASRTASANADGRWKRHKRQTDPDYRDKPGLCATRLEWAHPGYWRENRGGHPEYREPIVSNNGGCGNDDACTKGSSRDCKEECVGGIGPEFSGVLTCSRRWRKNRLQRGNAWTVKITGYQGFASDG